MIRAAKVSVPSPRELGAVRIDRALRLPLPVSGPFQYMARVHNPQRMKWKPVRSCVVLCWHSQQDVAMAPPTVKDEVRHSASPDIESLVYDAAHEVRLVAVTIA